MLSKYMFWRKKKKNSNTSSDKKILESKGVYLLSKANKKKDFPEDKKYRPIICEVVGKKVSTVRALTSKKGESNIEVTDKNFSGDIVLKKNGSYVTEKTYRIDNNSIGKKIGKFLGFNK